MALWHVLDTAIGMVLWHVLDTAIGMALWHVLDTAIGRALWHVLMHVYLQHQYPTITVGVRWYLLIGLCMPMA